VIYQNDPDWESRIWQLGTRENISLDIRKKHDWIDLVISMHEKRETWEKNLGRELNKQEVISFRDAFMATTGLLIGNWGHFWKFAKSSGEYWHCFEAILRGHVNCKGTFVGPTSITKFHACRNLSQEDVLTVWRKVIAGVLDMKGMEQEFIMMKQVSRVRNIVATFVESAGYDTNEHMDGTLLDWDAFQEDDRIPAAFKMDSMVKVYADVAVRNTTKATKAIPGLLDHLSALLKNSEEEVRLHVVFHFHKRDFHTCMKIHFTY
jgi:hypothetical protein